MNESVFRESVAALLRGKGAHASAENALADVAPELRNKRPTEGVHSVWEELEHMRIAQEDILQYSLDPEWKSPGWPAGYWPADPQSMTEEMWDSTVKGFFADLEKAVNLALDESVDLTAKIAHGKEHTYLRELLLIADHNAYHLGQVVQTRKLLRDWPA